MGSFVFTVICCRGVKGYDLVGKTDPYVLLKYGHQKLMTHVENEAGEDANFFATFRVDTEPKLRPLTVQVWDRDWVMDELMGSAKVDLAEVAAQGHCLWDVPLLDSRGRDNGSVRMAVRYYPGCDKLNFLPHQ